MAYQNSSFAFVITTKEDIHSVVIITTIVIAFAIIITATSYIEDIIAFKFAFANIIQESVEVIFIKDFVVAFSELDDPSIINLEVISTKSIITSVNICISQSWVFTIILSNILALIAIIIKLKLLQYLIFYNSPFYH